MITEWYRTKDSKKFGKGKKPKNNSPTKKCGYCYGKELRKEWRKEAKAKAHAILKGHITETETKETD